MARKKITDIVPAAKITFTPTAMAVSTWLKDHTGSHNIYEAKALQASFFKHTGLAIDLPKHTAKETRKAIAIDPRGGTCGGNDNDKVCYGYEVASYLCSYLTGYHSNKLGRGFMWQDCIEALEKAGR